jgi:hypothetical protein
VYSSFQTLILQALCACKISVWNEEYTSEMLPGEHENNLCNFFESP